MTNVTIPILVTSVGTVNVVVQNPLNDWTLLKKFSVFTDEALVTVPTLGLVDIPAILLRAVAYQFLIAPGGNLDFLVRLPTGTGDIEGVISTVQHP